MKFPQLETSKNSHTEIRLFAHPNFDWKALWCQENSNTPFQSLIQRSRKGLEYTGNLRIFSVKREFSTCSRNFCELRSKWPLNRIEPVTWTKLRDKLFDADTCRFYAPNHRPIPKRRLRPIFGLERSNSRLSKRWCQDKVRQVVLVFRRPHEALKKRIMKKYSDANIKSPLICRLLWTSNLAKLQLWPFLIVQKLQFVPFQMG